MLHLNRDIDHWRRPQDFNDTATFTYEATDGLASATGTVFVTVLPVNDPLMAVDDTATMQEDTVVFLDMTTLVANDLDIDGTV